jgi:formylglycine-generating enzyme required for sulfatase activity
LTMKYTPYLRISSLIIFTAALAFIHPDPAFALQESAFEVAGVEFQLVAIEPGSFIMGSRSHDGDERPAHKVNIDYSFDIGKTEVTVAHFRAFVEATGYEKKGWTWDRRCSDHMGTVENRPCQNPGFEQTDNHPIVRVDYNDAKAFCTWLSQQTGRQFRLPTEAEWEYACRAGTNGDYAGDIEQMAWFNTTSGGLIHPVARKKPNPWGLYDMHGNVREWCEDIYYWNYKNAPSDGSAAVTLDVPAEVASRRVQRGGCCCSTKESCRSSSRYGVYCFFRQCSTGFRIVRCAKPATTDAKPPASAAKKTRKPSVTGAARSARLTLTIGDVNFDLVRIDPGTFIMGSEHNYVDQYKWTYELPAHKVTIDYSYYMGSTEVTLEQFGLFVAETGYVTDAEKEGWAFNANREKGWHDIICQDWRFPGYVQNDEEPVTHIGWYDTVAFCQWLSEKTGRDVRLPTEAEWEYACRAGTTEDYAGTLGEMAWCQWTTDTITRTHPVAQKKPNPSGLYDMHGNVWEWVQDMWHDGADGAPTDGSAWLDSTGRINRGVVRGGSFNNPPWLLRSYIRMRTPLGCRIHFNNGFRIAMSAD